MKTFIFGRIGVSTPEMYYLFSVYFTTLVFSVFNDSAAWDMLDKPGADPEDVSTAREYLIGKDMREIPRHHSGFKGATNLKFAG